MDTKPDLSGIEPPLPPAPPKKRSRGALDKEILAQLQLAEEIAQAAKLPAHAPALQESEIAPTAPDALLAKIATCRALLTGAVDQRSHKRSQTAAESTDETELVRLLRRVQSAAQQKYADAPTSDNWKGDYYIGHNLALSRASLATYAEGILQKLETDTLPGVNAAFRTTLSATYTRWVATNGEQAGAHGSAVASRQTALTLLETLQKERRRIQRAADFQFPVGDPEHATARAAFHLEKSRPFR